jgi:hypothetical protein
MTCIEAFRELSLYTLYQPVPPFIHQNAVDAYSAQHLHADMSVIQRIFGLMGLCLATEYGLNGYDIQLAHIAKSKDPDRATWPLIEPQALEFQTNVGDVLVADDKDAAIRRWVETTWHDWESAHRVVRQFCTEPLP